MPKFHCYGAVSGGKYLGEFEAETADAAIILAEAEASVSLCHQCSSEVEDPEIGEITAEPA